MSITESHLPEVKTIEETRSGSLRRCQRRAVLAWMLALPCGWLLGWGAGAAIGYRNPALLDPFTLKLQLHIAHKIGASDGGLLGGAIGVTIGFMLAAWITMSSLRTAIPGLKPRHLAVVVFSWTFPMILFLAAVYFLKA